LIAGALIERHQQEEDNGVSKIQRQVKSYAMDPTDETFWSVARESVRREDESTLVDVVSMRAGLGIEKRESTILPTYDKLEHGRRLNELGERIDEAFKICVDGREERLEAMRSKIKKSPRVKHRGLEKWCKEESDWNRIDYGPFGMRAAFEDDYIELKKNYKKLPAKSAMRREADAERTLGIRRNRGRRKGSKHAFSWWDSNHFIESILTKEDVEFMATHLLLVLIDALHGVGTSPLAENMIPPVREGGRIHPDDISVGEYAQENFFRNISPEYRRHTKPRQRIKDEPEKTFLR